MKRSSPKNDTLRVLFVSRESEWSGAVRIRGALWQKALYGRVDSFETFCAESLFRLKRKTNYPRWYKAFLALRTAMALRGKCFDLMVINKINYHTLGAVLICWLKRRPYILDVDDWEYRTDGSGSPKTLFQRFGDRCARRALLVVAASSFLKEYFSFCPRVAYIPSCAGLSAAEHNATERDGVIFSWMGMVDRQDTLESVKQLLETFMRVQARYPQARLRIMSKGIFSDTLRQWSKSMPQASISFFFDVPPRQLDTMLAQSDVGVLLFKEHETFYRAKSPTRLFQYFALGKPVIATAMGECSRFIEEGKNGFLIRAPEELQERMERLCQDQALRAALSQQARASGRRWNQDTVAKQLAAALEDVL